MDRRGVLTGLCAGALPRLALASSSPATDISGRFAPVLASRDVDEHPDLRGVVIHHQGQLVAERYYNGEMPLALHDIRSAGKSVTALLVGAAVDRGMIKSVFDPVERYWPQATGSAIGDVQLADILTMRSGLAANDDVATSAGNEDRFDQAADPLRFLLGVPRATPPGTTYVYNSLTAYTAGLVVEKATGQREADFGRQVLFKPLGLTDFEWRSDVAGHTKGQGNLSITTRDLANIGQMVLDRGRFGTKTIISASWIDSMLRSRVIISNVDPYADAYGYFWYSKTHSIAGKPVETRFASGNGGNKIYIVPSRSLVVAITSSAYGHGYGQRRSQSLLLDLLQA